MTFPTEAQIEIAFAILGRLIDRGADPRLLPDGRITLGGGRGGQRGGRGENSTSRGVVTAPGPARMKN